MPNKYAETAEGLKRDVLDVTTFKRERCEHESDHEERRVHFKTEAIRDHRKGYNELSDVIQETSISQKYAYEWIEDALNDIIDGEPEDRDAFEAHVYEELEADCYTATLTAWLASSCHHVYYLTEAMQSCGDCDGFQALALAQVSAMQEIYLATWKVVEDLANDNE